MAKWSEQASQWHEMYCHDLEVMSLNPGRVKLWVCSTSDNDDKSYLIQNFINSKPGSTNQLINGPQQRLVLSPTSYTVMYIIMRNQREKALPSFPIYRVWVLVVVIPLVLLTVIIVIIIICVRHTQMINMEKSSEEGKIERRANFQNLRMGYDGSYQPGFNSLGVKFGWDCGKHACHNWFIGQLIHGMRTRRNHQIPGRLDTIADLEKRIWRPY